MFAVLRDVGKLIIKYCVTNELLQVLGIKLATTLSLLPLARVVKLLANLQQKRRGIWVELVHDKPLNCRELKSTRGQNLTGSKVQH